MPRPPHQKPDDTHERALAAKGFARICGVDEAGRGPLAGPVVAAAVVLCGTPPEGLDDSKKLTAEKRARLCDALMRGHLVGVAAVPHTVIDRINIRKATLRAMAAAVNALALPPDHALIDGRDVPEGLPCPALALVGGDGRALSIAAASIVAKHTRDGIMRTLGAALPAYGFARHAGYGTRAHIEALREYGASSYHRTSFSLREKR